jgi:alkanesulfonate monooxygenase SsuD/methylene tetrahydromethanopterin reductase-like flavin-dependent oxidoreductase (luciferase family)
MFIEGINMVLKIWESEPPYNLEGKFWKVSTEKTMIPEIGQGIILNPFQKPHPPIVGTVVAPYSKGVTAMAERGWLPISANFLMPEWVKTHWPNYVEGKKNIGQVADPADWRIAKSIFVAEDEATAQRYGKSAEGPYHFYFKQLVRKLVGFGNRGNLFKVDQSMPDSAITPEYVTDQLVIAGTVNSVVDQILAFREKVGDFGTLVYACHDWMDPKLGKRSMELLAEKVMPLVNAAIAKGSSKAA